MTTNDKNERIRRVLAYIDDHLSEIEQAREVAEAVDVSYHTLRKQFRKQVGIPVGAYITRARVNEARRLLIETDNPVYVVCRKIGYSSDSNGIRAFKHCTGMTMGEYRRRYQGGE
jgi:AraC-like DNA-binding protein